MMRNKVNAFLPVTALLLASACHSPDASTSAFMDRAKTAVSKAMPNVEKVKFNKATVNTRTHDNWACGTLQDGREWVYAETAQYRKTVFTAASLKWEEMMGLCLNAPGLKAAGQQGGATQRRAG